MINIIFVVFMVIINGSGTVINFLVAVMFLRFRSKLFSVNNDKFLFSLVIADYLVGLFGTIGGILFHAHLNRHVSVEIYICF